MTESFSADPSFYYDEQIKRYFVQFMAIFYGFHVRTGWTEDKKPRLIKVPIYSGYKDRVVAAIKGENTQNKPIRLPAMSATITGFDMMPERRKGPSNERRMAIMPTGGLFPDEIHVVQQRMPVPYRLTIDLTMWTSNKDQQFQLMEQIMMLFNPMLQIQSSDEVTDWTKLTMVEMMGVRQEENYPAGSDRRIILTTIEFDVPIYISAPAEVHKRYIKDIYVRMGVVSNASTTSEEIIAELDQQGEPYELNFSLDDVDLE